MITVGMNYKVLPGKEGVFEKACSAVVEAMRKMPGHTRTRLYRDVHEPQTYLIASEWSDREAFDQFIRSEQFRSVANWGKEQILAGRPTHDIFEKQS